MTSYQNPAHEKLMIEKQDEEGFEAGPRHRKTRAGRVSHLHADGELSEEGLVFMVENNKNEIA